MSLSRDIPDALGKHQEAFRASTRPEAWQRRFTKLPAEIQERTMSHVTAIA
jgi:hypothetical protein